MFKFIEIQPYRQNLYYIHGIKTIDDDLEKIFLDLKKSIKMTRKDFNKLIYNKIAEKYYTHSGICFPIIYKNIGLMFIMNYSGSKRTMVHELSHLLLYVFSFIDMKLSFQDGSDEAYCYLFEEVFDKISNFIDNN